MNVISIAKKLAILFGDKDPKETLDNGVGKTAKEVITGNESKTSKSSSVAPKGNNSPTTTQSGTGKIGEVGAAAQKDEELVNSAIRDIRSGKYTTQEQKAAIERFQTRIDNAVAAGRVPSQRDQQTFLNLREARAYGVYQSFQEQAKNPNAPAIVKDIASRPYQKDMSNPWKNFKGYDADTILKIYTRRNVDKMSDWQKNQVLTDVMQKHEGARTAIEKMYGTTAIPFKSPDNAVKPSEREATKAMDNIAKGTAWSAAGKFKQYPDEPLNPRIKNARAFVDENTVYLNMTVDGKEKSLTVTNKNTVEAFHAGALPLNVLANKALAVTEGLQANLSSRFELSMDEQREQDMSQGIHR